MANTARHSGGIRGVPYRAPVLHARGARTLPAGRDRRRHHPPFEITLDAPTDTLYVTDRASGLTRPIVLSTGIGATNVRFSADGRTAFILSDALFLLDTATHTIRSRVDDLGPLLYNLWGDSPFTAWLLIPDRAAAAGGVLIPRSYGSASGLALDEERGWIFASHNRSVAWFDLGNPPRRGVIPLDDGVRTLVAAPEIQTALAIHRSAVSILDTGTLRLVGRVPILGIPSASSASNFARELDVAIAPEARRAFVSHSESEVLTAIDLVSGRAVHHAIIPARRHGLAVRPDGTRVYVSTPDDGIRVLDETTLAPLATIPVDDAGALNFPSMSA